MEEAGKTQNKIVQTYAEDVAKVIEGDRSGLIKKIIHGEEEHETEKIKLSPELKKNKILMFLSLLFVFLAIAIFTFFLFQKNINTLEIEKQFTPIIFNDKSVFFEIKDLKKEEIVQTVINEVRKTEIKTGGVEGIYLSVDKKVINFPEFLKLIKGNLVLGNSEGVNFFQDNFLMGVVNNETKDFFMLLKVRSVADVFDPLRTWENKMFLDLHGFFGVDISPETKYLLTASFEDAVVENKNARILFDKDKKIVMMYIFADNNSLIITNTKNAAHEIILRLASSQIKK